MRALQAVVVLLIQIIHNYQEYLITIIDGVIMLSERRLKSSTGQSFVKPFAVASSRSVGNYTINKMETVQLKKSTKLFFYLYFRDCTNANMSVSTNKLFIYH